MTPASTPTGKTSSEARTTESTVRRVREEYSRIAAGATCPSPAREGDAPEPSSQNLGYENEEIDSLPTGADLGLGCGAPVGALELRPGETVLDLGSGAGIDVFLAARRVGPTGRVIGVDMTPEMLELARANAEKGGYDNVEFRSGRLEALPVDDESIDAVTSNCVINLVPDKAAVYAEIARVLRPGGRAVISDLVLERPLPAALARELGGANCVVTAIQRDEYLEVVRRAGLGEAEILAEVDYLAAVGWTDLDRMNEESRAVLDRAGVSFDEIRGTIISLTLRATKRVPGTRD